MTVVYKEQIFHKSKLSDSRKSGRKHRVIMMENISEPEIILIFIYSFMN